MSWWKRWVAFWDVRETGEVLALLRVGVGLGLVMTLLSTSLAGLVDALWIDIEYGGMRPLGKGPKIIRALGGPTPQVVHAFFVLALLAGGAMVAGIGGRLSSLIALLAWNQLSWINGHAGGSYDDLLSNLLFLTFLGQSTATWSLDCRLRTGRWTSGALVPRFPRILFVIQLVIMYASTGLQKLSAYWTPVKEYSALWYILQQPSWHWRDMGWAAPLYPVTQAFTAFTWFFEILSPLILIWVITPRKRDLRHAFALSGALLHIGIETTMNVGPFSYLALLCYLALWRPGEIRTLFKWPPASRSGTARARA